MVVSPQRNGKLRLLYARSHSLALSKSVSMGPRATWPTLYRLLALPTRKQTHGLVEDEIDRLNRDPPLILVDEANHLNVDGLELLRHIHDMTECGMVLVGT